MSGYMSLEDIDAVVDSILAGNSGASSAATALGNHSASPHQGSQARMPSSHRNGASPATASDPVVALEQRAHSRSSHAADSQPAPGIDGAAELSVDAYVERVLSGHGGGGGVTQPSAWAPSSQPPTPPSLRGSRRQTQDALLKPPPPLPPQQHQHQHQHEHQQQQQPYTTPSRGAQRGSDPLLRRFTLWEERKTAKRLKAVYDALLDEAAACTFQPSRDPATLLPSKVLECVRDAGPTSGKRGSSLSGAGGACLSSGEVKDGGRASPAHARASTVGAYDRPALSAAVWNSLTAPSTLYAGNKAWGYDEYLARMAVARYERERARRAAEEQQRRYTDRAHFSRSPTRPEPFELSCYYRPPVLPGRGGAATAAAVARSPARHRSQRTTQAPGGGTPSAEKEEVTIIDMGVDDEREESSGEARGGRDGYYYSSQHATPATRRRLAEMDTFATVGPRIRQQLLFSEATTEQLEQATKAVKPCFEN